MSATTIYFILSSLCILSADSFNYSDLQNITSSCFKRGTCHVHPRSRLDISLNWKDRNCFCDNKCIEYSDCCLDAKAFNANLMKENIDRFECVHVPISGHYYMKGTCLNEWKNEQVYELCVGASPNGVFNEDPFLQTPVTSFASDITYKNYYCAICNNEEQNKLQVWQARLSCPNAPHFENSYIKENIIFKHSTWGIQGPIDNISQFSPCDVFPAAPDNVMRKVRECIQPEHTCHSSWTDPLTADLCRSYTTVVYGPMRNISDDYDLNQMYSSEISYQAQVYRNYHCAKCNFVKDAEISCNLRDFRVLYGGYPVSFSVLFDFGTKTSKCTNGEIWDSLSKSCRRVVCLRSNHEFRQGKCIKVQETVTETTETSTPGYDVTQISPHNESKLFRKCDKMFFNKSGFTKGENGSVVISSYRRTYTQDEYEIHEEGILVCLPYNYSRLMGWLTFCGLGLSCVCIFFHLCMFFFVPELRNLSGKNLASLCVALFVAYACFLVTTFKEDTMSDCSGLAYAMYYAFLSSFTWMNVMSFDIWRTLQLATTELRLTSGKQWKKFIYYSLYAWIFPAIALAIVIAIDYIKPNTIPPSFLPELGTKFCWFGQRNAILIYFAAPLAFIMTINILFFILAVRMVASTARSSSLLSSTQPQQTQLKLYLRLALLMGLSWISGIVAGYAQVEYVWYLFILLNAFQGVFILVAFTCTKKVRRAVRLQSCRSLKRSIMQKSLQKKDSGSSRHVLESQDSNHSNLSNFSNTQLSTSVNTTMTNISLKSV